MVKRTHADSILLETFIRTETWKASENPVEHYAGRVFVLLSGVILAVPNHRVRDRYEPSIIQPAKNQGERILFEMNPALDYTVIEDCVVMPFDGTLRDLGLEDIDKALFVRVTGDRITMRPADPGIPEAPLTLPRPSSVKNIPVIPSPRVAHATVSVPEGPSVIHVNQLPQAIPEVIDPHFRRVTGEYRSPGTMEAGPPPVARTSVAQPTVRGYGPRGLPEPSVHFTFDKRPDAASSGPTGNK